MSALQSADMARIYDNIESKFVNGLQDLITDVGITRVDFCVGYFNLRGWDLVVNQIDQIPGDFVYENDKQMFRRCRLLIGMHQPDEELVRRLYSTSQIPDAANQPSRLSPLWFDLRICNAQPATQIMIDTYMSALGFIKENDKGRYFNGTYIVWDVVPRNVLVDADGDMYVVNAEIKKL